MKTLARRNESIRKTSRGIGTIILSPSIRDE